MQIALKLFAGLTDYLPPERDGNVVMLEVAEGTTIGDLVERFKLPHKLVHLVLVNGRYIAPEQRQTYRLEAADALAIWPPVAGG